MEQLQAPPGSNLGQEPAKGWFAPGAGRAPAASRFRAQAPGPPGVPGPKRGLKVAL